jgi:hypothetical protein
VVREIELRSQSTAPDRERSPPADFGHKRLLPYRHLQTSKERLVAGAQSDQDVDQDICNVSGWLFLDNMKARRFAFYLQSDSDKRALYGRISGSDAWLHLSVAIFASYSD